MSVSDYLCLSMYLPHPLPLSLSPTPTHSHSVPSSFFSCPRVPSTHCTRRNAKKYYSALYTGNMKDAPEQSVQRISTFFTSFRYGDRKICSQITFFFFSTISAMLSSLQGRSDSVGEVKVTRSAAAAFGDDLADDSYSVSELSQYREDDGKGGKKRGTSNSKAKDKENFATATLSRKQKSVSRCGQFAGNLSTFQASLF